MKTIRDKWKNNFNFDKVYFKIMTGIKKDVLHVLLIAKRKKFTN